MQKITFKTLFQLLLHDKPALFYGQLLTLAAILVSIPVPLMLPLFSR
ncbi:MAG: hypothetical protein AB7D43_13245 [Sulfurimonadaceae bacterium]